MANPYLFEVGFAIQNYKESKCFANLPTNECIEIDIFNLFIHSISGLTLKGQAKLNLRRLLKFQEAWIEIILPKGRQLRKH